MKSRCLTKQEAAAYCGCKTISSFNDWVRRGIVPPPIKGTRRWDARAIDAALDRKSGLCVTISSSLSPLEEWKAKRASRVEGLAHGSQDAR